MVQKQELLLLYGFSEERLAVITEIAKGLKIAKRIIKPLEISQRVGFLIGKKGFKEEPPAAEPLDKELLVIAHLSPKRLDKLLEAMKAAEFKVPYKCVLTPKNTLWTLDYLAEHMTQEHASMQEKNG